MNIYKKLFEAKKEIGKISKDNTNPFYNSKYFDINKLLEHVEPILQEKGLFVLQPIIDSFVVTQIINSEDGEMITSSLEIKETAPQKKGIEITYYRRYTLSSLLGLQAEDDDANGTVKETTQTKEETPVKWLSDKQSQTVINNGVDKIKECLAYYDGKTIRDDGNKYCISKKLKLILETALTV